MIELCCKQRCSATVCRKFHLVYLRYVFPSEQTQALKTKQPSHGTASFSTFCFKEVIFMYGHCKVAE